MALVQVISGVERRRRWSEEQKRQIVEAAFAPGSTVSEVARQADVYNGTIYKWRQELQRADSGFTQVVVKAEEAPVCSRHDVIEVAFGNGTHLRISSAIPSELAASVIKAMVRR